MNLDFNERFLEGNLFFVNTLKKTGISDIHRTKNMISLIRGCVVFVYKKIFPRLLKRNVKYINGHSSVMSKVKY